MRSPITRNRAWIRARLDENGYTAIEAARINKHIEAINLQQSLLENRITLLSLLGMDDAGATDTGVKP